MTLTCYKTRSGVEPATLIFDATISGLKPVTLTCDRARSSLELAASICKTTLPGLEPVTLTSDATRSGLEPAPETLSFDRYHVSPNKTGLMHQDPNL